VTCSRALRSHIGKGREGGARVYKEGQALSERVIKRGATVEEPRTGTDSGRREYLPKSVLTSTTYTSPIGGGTRGKRVGEKSREGGPGDLRATTRGEMMRTARQVRT